MAITRFTRLTRLTRHRRWLCTGLVALLLNGQWAAVAYACQALAPPARPAALASSEAPEAQDRPGGQGSDDRAAAAADDAAPGCTGHHAASAGAAPAEPESPLRCKAHCQADEQSVNSSPAPGDAPSAVSGLLLLRVLDQAQAEALAAVMPVVARAAGPPPGTPPIYLSLLLLRR
jgi:hypothetical protein